MPISEYVVPNGDVPLAVRMHRPDDEPRPAVLVTGSWLTVRDQMPDHYAAALAARGHIAVTFDFAGFGATDAGDIFDIAIGSARPPFATGPQGPIHMHGV